MDIEIKVPSLGESESEATLISWLKKEGDAVVVDDVLAEIESDKITMEITALDAGILKSISKQVDDTVEPGEVIGLIDGSEQAVKAASTSTAADTTPTDEAVSEVEVKETTAEAPATDAPAPVTKTVTTAPLSNQRSEERVPMSRLRKRIAERLKSAQNTAAMLTTFNEVNLQPVMDLRSRYGQAFQNKHGVKLGFMSFFVRAVSQAISQHPALNAYIEADNIVYHNYLDVGIAVSTEKGLVVPTLRDAHLMNLAQIEQGISDLAGKARDGGLLPDDLKGGTFSITNGGVFGSMLSTPILNPPQSGILGMHTIQKRAVVENDTIVIRPMMYLALSYDHRLIDGSDAVRFLVAVKEALEYPGSLTLDL
ncbi:dihydrolipoyllysine-residue succinyltransferase [Mariprofundus sp. EBB-1]|uniref:dihydrolipoyllysine-residue succinyltransferase n=1 Tax=Mariprofundus sp. EBB-1 TaxID=2650971 RepID=UPI000EF257CB|nr:dihydrolipoyllysine-residue succinyltransferase [Mariprofundus sp. EBB-1]RLL54053.1 dihydrolipoyllysine-residue succinyltransferase [Mariprofundus sp. EBB-1]